MSSTKQDKESRSSRIPDFRAVLAVLCVLLFGTLIVVYTSELHDNTAWNILSKICWKNATVRPPVLLVLIVAGWGWVVSMCRMASLNLDLVLGGKLQPPETTYHAALVLTCILLASHLVHLAASELHGVTWRPWLRCNLFLHGAFLALGVLPMQAFYPASRFSLLRALIESVFAPFAPVTFWHVIVADYLTSLAKAFSDLQLTVCISSHIFSSPPDAAGRYVRSTALWEAHHEHCADSLSNALMLGLPFWWRLMQCLKVYSITREKKNLWNALKYSTAFPLVYCGYLRRHSPSLAHDRLFVLAALVQSSYCYAWDVHMDWGLFRRRRRGACGVALREPLLVTHRKSVYVALCAFNLLLRFAWALSVFGGIPGRGGGMFFFEVIEISRRTMWAVFRIEWEVVVKVYHASYSSLPTMNPGANEDESAANDETQPLASVAREAED